MIKTIISDLIEQSTHFGDLVFYGALLVFTLILKEYALFTKLLVSFIIITIVSVAIKALYFKDRPKKEKYRNKIEKINASSFPSIHAMRILGICLILGLFINTLFAYIIFTLLVIVVSYSRIHIKKHYFWDVLAGLILSIIINIPIVLYL